MDKPDKRRKYDETFKAQALRVTHESRFTPAAARALNIQLELLYQWQNLLDHPKYGVANVSRTPGLSSIKKAAVRRFFYR